MKILILNSILRTPENYVIPPVESIKDCMIYNLGSSFCKLGHEVTLIAADDYKPIQEETYDFEIIFQKTRLKKIFWPSVFPLQPALIKYLFKNKKKFDLIITSEVFAVSTFFSVLIAKKKTLIWHEMNVHQKFMKKIPSKSWHNIIVKIFYGNTFVVPRSVAAGNFIKKYIRNTSDLIVEHGVNLDKFICSEEKDRQFIVVSQLIPRKNISSIINKFHSFILKYQMNDFKLNIVGKGDMKDEILEQISQLNLEDNVFLLGHIPHDKLGLLMSRSAALLVDTKQDLNMVSIPEAIAAGTPVITNMVPTTASFIAENGLGVAKNDWNEDDLYDIIKNKEKYIKACILQREKLSAKHSAELLIKNYSDHTKRN